MSQYVYTKSPVALDSLEAQIAASSIIIAVDMNNTNVFGDQLTLAFKADLSDPDKSTLDAIVDAHDGISLAQPAQPVSIADTLIVTTQFEKRDKTLKLCKGKAEVGEDGIATILLKVPGTPGSADGRWISRGVAFFDEHTPGDAVIGIYFVDHDNILGNGVDFVVGSYTEDELDDGNKGWWITPNGFIIAESLGGYGFGPAGFYMQLIGKKGSGTTGTLRVNIEWGKTE